MKRIAGHGVISSQVAQEFAWTVRRKLGLTVDETSRILRSYQAFRFVPIEMHIVKNAIATSESSQISFWDALIIEAAVSAGCKTVFTEDLGHKQVIHGVQVINPFA